jgi:hypothetical protein
MGLRDRFYSPATARALLSWRLAAGTGVAIVAVVLGAHWGIALIIGLAVYAGLVWRAMPPAPRTPTIDPFTVGEPWRHFVTGSQRAAKRVHATVAGTTDGPLKDRMTEIAARLDQGIAEAWTIARRGDQIDDAVGRLDPTGLRSKLETLERQQAAKPSDDLAEAIASVRAQVASADRLKAQSAETADRLRLTQTRLDEVAARATEVSVGAGDTDRLAHDVDDLVIEFESLRQAVEELDRP